MRRRLSRDCTIEGCEREFYAKELCALHYNRAKNPPKWIWHRQADTGAYRSWKSMLDRTVRPSGLLHKDYGGRGITVCDRWRNSFLDFLSDMGERPEGMSLDRIDVDGNYEPGNCRWATAKEQANNKRPVNKIQCKRGHLFSEVGQYTNPTTGSKDCRGCMAIRRTRFNEIRREKRRQLRLKKVS